uniref:G_PROTEIN_RECEP_F1_2 domain-containing protein n=1 Tax=Panagrellus redivivus TaxID=6233 RepID=A0A7E4VBK2_PANRE
MSSYRGLVLVYFPFAIITTIVIAICIPIYDQNSGKYRFYEQLFKLEPHSDGFEIFFITVIYTFDMIIIDLLLVTLIDRYVIVSKTVITRSAWAMPLFYSIILITHIIDAIFVNFSNVLSVLDRKQEMCEYDLVRSCVIPTSAVWQISRLGGFIAIIWLNVSFGRKHAHNASLNLIRLHKTLTRSVIVTTVYTLVFTRLPIILVLVGYAVNNDLFLSLSLNIIIVCRSFALLGQMLTTIYLVKPYRVFVLKLLHLSSSSNTVKIEIRFPQTSLTPSH